MVCLLAANTGILFLLTPVWQWPGLSQKNALGAVKTTEENGSISPERKAGKGYPLKKQVHAKEAMLHSVEWETLA